MRLTLTMPTAPAVRCSAEERTITGTALIYNVAAEASTGPVMFVPESLRWDDLAAVALCIDHDTTADVGHATDATDGPDRLDMTFAVDAGQAGDDALARAGDGSRDGLSVGVDVDPDGYTLDEDGLMTVTSGTLLEVSLTATPAIDDARVHDVGTPTGEDTPMPTNEPVAASTTPAPAAVPAAAPVVVRQAAAPTPPSRPGQAMNLRQAMRVARKLILSGRGPHVAAALGDVVVADDDAEGIVRPQWVGELWQASKTERPLIDSIGSDTLTGMRAYGFTREYADLVDVYEGGKTPIPSGTFKTIPAEAKAQPFAGGNDVERIYIDLGSEDFLASWYTAATDEYRLKTEGYVAPKLVAAATIIPGSTSVTDALGRMGAAAGVLGSTLSFIGFSPQAWQTFINLKSDEVPWWLQRQGEINLGTTSGSAGNLSFAVEPSLTGNQVMGGDKRAATWYEVPGGPIRVQALDVANGGVDVSVHGYGALIINDKRAIFSAPITPPAGG